VGKGLSHGSNAKGAARHAFRPLSNPPDESNNFNEANQHVNHLLVALFQAERGWAHAMELKALGETKQKNQHTPKRHYFLRRLHKAVKHAKYLEQLASATADDRTSLESQLYFHWMNGNYSLETSDWRVSTHLSCIIFSHKGTVFLLIHRNILLFAALIFYSMLAFCALHYNNNNYVGCL
jgi:hypothetical protein